MAFNILKGSKPSPRFSYDMAALCQIPEEQLYTLLEITFKHIVDDLPFSSDYLNRIGKEIGVDTDTLVGAIRGIGSFLTGSAMVTEEELRSDLERANLSAKMAKEIADFVKAQEGKLYKSVERERAEAVPVLREINWRVDIRFASGDGLLEPTVYALLRIAVNDGTRTDRVYLELDRDDLSLLETTLNRVKAEFTKAEATKERLFAKPE